MVLLMRQWCYQYPRRYVLTIGRGQPGRAQMTDCQRKPRVILWGPGQVGVGGLRALIAHPGLDLVGVVVHAEAKEGRDAGDLCGMPVTGVIATRDVDAALALDADVV